jgi:hypothetical protein
VFDAPKFVQTAERMMARRGAALSEESRTWWTRVHAVCAADGRWPRP